MAWPLATLKHPPLTKIHVFDHFATKNFVVYFIFRFISDFQQGWKLHYGHEVLLWSTISSVMKPKSCIMESTRSQHKRPEMLIIESRDPSGGFFQALLMVGYPPLQKSGILVGLSKDLGPFLIDFGGFQKVLVVFF